MCNNTNRRLVTLAEHTSYDVCVDPIWVRCVDPVSCRLSVGCGLGVMHALNPGGNSLQLLLPLPPIPTVLRA